MLWLLLQACEIDELPVLIQELQIKISYFGNIFQKGLKKITNPFYTYIYRHTQF